jgi:hypothetical protein
MELTFGTGFFCPTCGKELDYTTGFWGSLLLGPSVESMMTRMNREGGKLTSEKCGHSWIVKPGSRDKRVPCDARAENGIE